MCITDFADFFLFFFIVFSFVLYLLYSVFALLQALDADGDGRIQLDEFEGWVTKGFHMNLKQLETFAGKGESQAVLVDFLLSLRADVKGVMRRIVSKYKSEMERASRMDVDFDFYSSFLFQTGFIGFATFSSYLKHPNKLFFNVYKYILTFFLPHTLLHYL